MRSNAPMGRMHYEFGVTVKICLSFRLMLLLSSLLSLLSKDLQEDVMMRSEQPFKLEPKRRRNLQGLFFRCFGCSFGLMWALLGSVWALLGSFGLSWALVSSLGLSWTLFRS